MSLMSPSKTDSDDLRIREGSLDIAQRIPTEAQIDSDTDSVRKEEDDGGKYGVEEKEMFEPVEGPGDDSKLPETLSSYTLKKYPWRPYATQFEDILNNKYRGSGTAESPYLVTWLDHDPENPKQWSKPRQWSILGLASMLSLCVSLASSGYTGALPQVVEQFHCSEEVALLGLSLMLVGYAFGPLIWAPLSETFGRRKILFPTLAIYIFWSALCCASQNVQTLLVFRFLAGLFGSSTLAIPGGIVADVFPAETRGAALVMFTAAPFLGPALGPIAGGFLGESAGWRWVMALLALFALLVTTVCFILIPESFAPILLRARAKTLSEVTGKVYLTPMDAEQTLSVHQLMRNAIVRPWILLFLEPIVLILTIYMSVVYGTLYLTFAAFPIIFQQGRGWSQGIGGLAFLGVCTGMMIGVGIGVWDNERYRKLHRLHGGFAPPESRLPPVIYAGVAIIVGLAWFAATDAPDIHWASAICGSIFFGVGFLLVIVCTTNYLIDSYVIYAASVLAANSVLRSLFGCVFPLFTNAMFKNLGIHWGVAVPGFISAACFPFPILFYINGARIRAKCKFSAEAARVMDQMKSNLERQRTQARRESVASAELNFSDESAEKTAV